MNDDLQCGSESTDPLATNTVVVRSVFGGVFMGLANLVPGISGGTMLLAAGIYPRFIDAVAEITRFKFRFSSLLLLGCVVASAGLAILLLAGLFKDLVVHNRWVMYSLFIGLTLGGLPIVWRLAKSASPGLIAGAIGALLAMVILALLQMNGVVGGGGSNPLMLFLAGLAGASAMILPGVSGGYLLLLMGQYVPILTAIHQVKESLQLGDIAATMDQTTTVLIPVGIGVIVGVAVVGNCLQWLLRHHRKTTLGILIGLLLGSIVGLWPFQQAVQPKVGDTYKGQVVTEQSLQEIEPEDWPNEYFRPKPLQIVGSLLLISVGFVATVGVAMVGDNKSVDRSDE